MTITDHRTTESPSAVSLLRVTQHFAAAARRFTYDAHSRDRQWLALTDSSEVQVWAIAWPPGSATGWHDHGSATGAFQVLQGSLREDVWTGAARSQVLTAGEAREFGADHVHDVRNDSAEWALSVHAYRPVLDQMTRYALVDGRLLTFRVDEAGASW